MTIGEERVREIAREEIRLEMPSTHELLLHFGIEEAGSPGAILDEARAKASLCSCFTYKGKDMCWSPGIIGLLTQDQQDIYCVAGKTYKARPLIESIFKELGYGEKELRDFTSYIETEGGKDFFRKSMRLELWKAGYRPKEGSDG